MRYQAALIFQAIAGAFGFYGVGRLIMAQWGRGLIELLGLGLLVIVVLPMLGVNLFGRSVWYGMYCQGILQIILSALLTWSLWRDLKRPAQVREVEGER